MKRRRQFLSTLLLAWALTACSPASDSSSSPATAGTSSGAAESLGFSATGIETLNSGLQSLVDDGLVTGMVTMLSRHGEIVQSETFGYQDLERAVPMEPDTIFRIYSMSKPITGVAMMILHDRGLWDLEDRVSTFIPEFEGLQVAEEDENGEIRLVPQEHPMTMRDLMTHTAGLTYGPFSRSAVDTMYQQNRVLDPASSLQTMIDKLAEIPLRQQPGSLWHYSVATDVQGYIVEKLSGQPLPEFFAEEIFEPLGMPDTGFHVTDTEKSRLARTVTRHDDEGNLVRDSNREGNYLEPPGLASGGGGLVSTASDYMRFSQMLLNKGELGGIRIFSVDAVELLRSNQTVTTEANGAVQLPPGSGFGIDVAILLDPESSGSPVGPGSYWWAGVAGTWFWIDPVNDLAFVGMAQNNFFDIASFTDLSRQWTYDALVSPEL